MPSTCCCFQVTTRTGTSTRRPRRFPSCLRRCASESSRKHARILRAYLALRGDDGTPYHRARERVAAGRAHDCRGGRALDRCLQCAGQFYALRNRCPHQGAPLCLGAIKGMALPSKPGEYRWGREGEILCCPWHGWEFDLTSGRAIFNPHRVRVRTYEVPVEPDEEPAVE